MTRKELGSAKLDLPSREIRYVPYRTSTEKCASIRGSCHMTFNKPAHADDPAVHPTMPADERGKRSQPDYHDRARWLDELRGPVELPKE